MDPWIAPKESSPSSVKISRSDFAIPTLLGGVLPVVLWMSCIGLGWGPIAFPVELVMALYSGVLTGQRLARREGTLGLSLAASVGVLTAILQSVPSIIALVILPWSDTLLAPPYSNTWVMVIFALWTLMSGGMVAIVTAAGMWSGFREGRALLALVRDGDTPPSAMVLRTSLIAAAGRIVTAVVVFGLLVMVVGAALTLLGGRISETYAPAGRATVPSE